MTRATIDGNEAAVSVAYRLNEVCCIYPITPSSPMAELADDWSSLHRANLCGELSRWWWRCKAKAVRPARSTARCRAEALATTFTSSQGLLLMIPNIYKIAGELTSAVHSCRCAVACRPGLSIFGDHSGCHGGAARPALPCLASASVQEAHDLARWSPRQARCAPACRLYISSMAFAPLTSSTPSSCSPTRVPPPWSPRGLILPTAAVHCRRTRPFIRGTAQNPDVYFQARETVNPSIPRVPEMVEEMMTSLGELTGRTAHRRLHRASPGRAGVWC